MKIALIQGHILKDRPSDNLERVKQTLARQDLTSCELFIFPSLTLSGNLGPNVLARPSINKKLDQTFQDFLAVSAKYPAAAIASSHFVFDDQGNAHEETFIVQGGRALLREVSPECGEFFHVNGLTIGFGSSLDSSANKLDIIITFKEAPYYGEAFQAPSMNPGKAWRLNVSRVGGEGPIVYEGATYVCDPQGKLKAWADGFSSAVITFDTNSQSLAPMPVSPRDDLAVLYQAMQTGLRDFIKDNGGEKVVLGLSGGMDSALVATLAADALGPDKVLGVAMPTDFNAPESLSLANQLATNLGIGFLTAPIEKMRQSFVENFLDLPPASEKEGQLADENVQARLRGLTLMYLANREGRLLLATGNKSESAMGYCTLYGDTCGSIAPLGDLYKTKVFELARWLNRDGERIPERIITRPPSAELRADQKDEDTLPPYADLDDILARYLEGGASGSEVAKEGGHSPLTVSWVLSTLKKQGFKRSQSPFALRLSSFPLSYID